MLHHNVEVVINYQVLVNTNSALFILSLQLDSFVNLRHNSLAVIDAHRLEVNKLLDEEKSL